MIPRIALNSKRYNKMGLFQGFMFDDLIFFVVLVVPDGAQTKFFSRAKWLIKPALISGFRSVKRMGAVFPLLLKTKHAIRFVVLPTCNYSF